MAVLKIIYKQDSDILKQTRVRKYHDDNAIYDVINYCLNSEKTPHNLIGGYGLDVFQAADQMKRLTQAYGKDHGVSLRHFVFSLSEKETHRLGQYVFTELYRIAGYIALYYGHEYQIVFAVHEDKECPHVHFVMNTLNFVTGKKYPGDKKDYCAFQEYIKRFLYENYGFYLSIARDD